MARASVVFLLAMLAAGCPGAARMEAYGPTPSFDRAIVCVIHPFSTPGRTFTVRDDGWPVGRTRSKSYFCYGASPGPHRIELEAGGYVTLYTEPWHRHWVRQDDANRLSWIDERLAQRLIDDEGCDYETLLP